MLKKKSKALTETPTAIPDEQSAMYTRARHEWDERIGSAAAAAHSWKITAIISMLVAGGAVLGISHIGAQSKIQPYGVVLQGDNVIPAGPMSKLPDSQLKNMQAAEVRQFVEEVRSVYIDVNAQKNSIRKAYAFLQSSDPAFQQITKKFKTLSPFKRAESELVKVSFVTVLPLSDDTWQAEWSETLTSPAGKALGINHYKATLNTYQVAPTTRTQIDANPLGFFIKTFNDIQVN